MKIEKLKESHVKRNIVIVLIAVLIISAVILNFTRAKYRVTDTVSLINGTVNYIPYDFKIMAMYQESDSGTYVEIEEMPSSGYSINERESYCTLDNINKDNEAVLYTNIKGEHVISGLKQSSKCYLYFDKANTVRELIASYPTQSTRSDFSTTVTNTTTGTIYYADTSKGRTYYFAGNPTDNWVSFAGYYWRIIRINEDGSIRVIYSGNSESGPVETGEATQIGTSAFNEEYNENAYVGYMYGTPGSDTYEETHANINDSTIKTVLDNWYQQNLLSYSNYISTEAGFCNDRSVNITDEVWWADDTKLGYGTNATAYGPYGRLAINSNYRNVQIPSLKCSQARDYFTISGSSKGNHVLTYPVGLITSDEVILAGGFGGVNGSSSAHYLNTGQYYWTVSPSHYNVKGNTAGVYYVSSIGLLNGGWVYNLWGVRPVINLDKNVTISSGNGTIDSPYVVGA